MKKRLRDDVEVRRAQILDEAIRIIGLRGYHDFTVQEIAQRCDLTNGGLLYHFKSKEKLFLAVLTEYERRVEVDLHSLIQSFTTQDIDKDRFSRIAVLRLLRAIMTQSVNQPELARLFVVLQAEALNHAHPGHDFFRHNYTQFMEWLVVMLTAHTSEPLSTARQIYALMHGLEHQWMQNGSFDLLTEWDRSIAKIF